ncbi:ribosome maturation factor RimM [Propionibacteriaceae bacterium G1746]|uniref:ribosome maturation factor RimM n=1 Tax=Aestuariimicrobium sp. G57 TaxID=3418485 RepID=UPI003C2112A8
MPAKNDLVEVTVGVIGRAHGLRGDVLVEPRTDEPDRRFEAGASVRIEGTRRTLTVARSYWHSGRLVVNFAELPDRTAVEGARGWVLVCDVPVDELPSDEDEYFDRQLVGLKAVLADGTPVGVVAQVIHLPAQDLLAIDVDGTERLVPFVHELVPHVDLGAGTIEIAPVPGLLDDEADVVDPTPEGQE